MKINYGPLTFTCFCANHTKACTRWQHPLVLLDASGKVLPRKREEAKHGARPLPIRMPVRSLGDTVTVTVSVSEMEPAHHRVKLDCAVTIQKHEQVITGSADVLDPT